MRYALGLEYEGSHYHGWQEQNHGLATIQAQLQLAVAKVANHPVKVICAGRTDAGVHASGQVIHFDSTALRSERAWMFGINSHLPRDIRVNWVVPVGKDFHARFSAIAREYRYVIYNYKLRPVLGRQLMTWHFPPLNVALMEEALVYFIGTHDFSALRAKGCQAKSPIRTIEYLNLDIQQQTIVLNIKANAFLQHMVRNIVGMLMAIGAGKYPPVWVKQVLESGKRSLAGITAPPMGLTLTRVYYPMVWQIPLPNDGLAER